MHYSHLLGQEKLFQNPGAVLCFCSPCLVHMRGQRLPKQLDWDLVVRAFKIFFKPNLRAVCGVEMQKKNKAKKQRLALFWRLRMWDLLVNFNQEECFHLD